MVYDVLRNYGEIQKLLILLFDENHTAPWGFPENTITKNDYANCNYFYGIDKHVLVFEEQLF